MNKKYDNSNIIIASRAYFLQEKGEKHHPVSLRRLWNMLLAGEDDRHRYRKKALLFAFFRLGSSKDEGTHLRAIFLSPFSPSSLYAQPS
jgi:hypothetical protein